MDNEMLFTGLFQRLHGSGLHPVLSGELASANYPTDEHKPLRAVRCRQDAVHWHTEEYLDKGATSLEELWLSIWGVEPLDYMGVAPGSPGARELGLEGAPTASPGREPAPTRANPTTDLPAPPEAAEFANAYWYSGGGALKDLYSGSALPPSAPPMARFFADLMCGVARGVPGEVDKIRKGYKVLGFYPKPPTGWWEDIIAAGVAFSIYLISQDTRSDLLVAGAVGDYYRASLDRVHPDLSSFIFLDADDAQGAEMTARWARVVVDLSDKRGAKLKRNQPELGLLALHEYERSRHAGDVVPGSSSMTMTEALQKVAGGDIDITSTSPYGNETAVSASIAEPVSRGYAELREFCLQLADRRAVPRGLAEDLIPKSADADWLVKPLPQFEEALEQAFPGRRDWLRREGVTPTDFERFWSRPSWVQNYIEALVTRNVQLEVGAHLEAGEDEDFAYGIAAASLPMYGNIPGGPDDPQVAVPWELFDRVEPYWAALDMTEIERGLMESGWSTAGMRIRAEIRAGHI